MFGRWFNSGIGFEKWDICSNQWCEVILDLIWDGGRNSGYFILQYTIHYK